jgi:hypothetical protein
MIGGRPAERLAFRAAEGDERLQVLLILLLALCVLAGWLLIRELAPASGQGIHLPTTGIAPPGS